MSYAIGYIRISTKDQSNFSIEGQESYIRSFCEREKINLLEIFKDDGFSAKSFDRPSWKELENFISKHHNQINYLVVCKYDRFSRNAAEGLNMIEKLEKKYKIIILSVFERIHIDHHSPYFFKQRADMLVTAEFELHVIRERTKFGIRQSASSGRLCHRAPWGYHNERDADDKPIIVMEPEKQPVIKFIYESFLMGVPQNEILKQAAEMGYSRQGRSAIKRVIECPIYAGLVHVPAFKNETEKIVNGIHEPMVPVHYYYEAQKLLRGEKGPRTILNEQVPLRGVLRCQCGKELTGGRSKGRNDWYWYYFCVNHRDNNYNAKKVHQKFDEVLKLMNLPAKSVAYLKESFERQFHEELKKKGQKLEQVQSGIKDIRKQMESLEEKYIKNDITKEVYERWHSKLEPNYNILLAEQTNLQKTDNEYYNRYQNQLPRLNDIHYLYHQASIIEKQELIKLWFKWSLAWVGNIFRTTYMMPIFSHNLEKMSNLQLLILDNSRVISLKNTVGSGNGIRTRV